MKLLLLAALALAALIVSAPWLYEHFELAALGYVIKGVDVSHYQGDIDWQALREGGVRFAYIKATEGATLRDARFAENWRRSRDAGILRGAYHYFSLCKPGAEQAANFIAATPVEAGILPHALDVEQMEPCPNGQRVADPLAEIGAFLDAAEKRFGRRPVLYTTREFYDAYFGDGRFAERLAKERFWLRSLHRTPNFSIRPWTLWQYHNRGSRPGIRGPVDLNHSMVRRQRSKNSRHGRGFCELAAWNVSAGMCQAPRYYSPPDRSSDRTGFALASRSSSAAAVSPAAASWRRLQ